MFLLFPSLDYEAKEELEVGEYGGREGIKEGEKEEENEGVGRRRTGGLEPRGK